MNILTWTMLKKKQILHGCETFAFKFISNLDQRFQRRCRLKKKFMDNTRRTDDHNSSHWGFGSSELKNWSKIKQWINNRATTLECTTAKVPGFGWVQAGGGRVNKFYWPNFSTWSSAVVKSKKLFSCSNDSSTLLFIQGHVSLLRQFI